MWEVQLWISGCIPTPASQNEVLPFCEKVKWRDEATSRKEHQTFPLSTAEDKHLILSTELTTVEALLPLMKRALVNEGSIRPIYSSSKPKRRTVKYCSIQWTEDLWEQILGRTVWTIVLHLLNAKHMSDVGRFSAFVSAACVALHEPDRGSHRQRLHRPQTLTVNRISLELCHHGTEFYDLQSGILHLLKALRA